MMNLSLSYFFYICHVLKKYTPFCCGLFEFAEGILTQLKDAVFEMCSQSLNLVNAFSMYLSLIQYLSAPLIDFNIFSDYCLII